MIKSMCVVTLLAMTVSSVAWGASCIVKGSTVREPASVTCHDAYVEVGARSFCSVLSEVISFTTRPSRGVIILFR